jgi:uncharacterized protein (DUF2384 family)
VPGSPALVDVAYAKIVSDIRSALTASELAEIVGVRERQIHHWSSGTHRPQAETRDRLLEVHYLVNQLSDVYTPEGIDIWLHGRNRSLGGRRPIDLLGENEFSAVLDAIERLRTGAM